MKSKIKKLSALTIKNIRKYLSNNVLFISYVLLSLFIGIFTRFFTVGKIFYIKPFFSDLTIILFIGSLSYLFKSKNRFIYLFIIILFFTFLGVANTIYYEFYHSFISVNLLATMKMLGEVDDSISSKLKIYQFIYLFAPLLFAIVRINLNKRNHPIKQTERKKTDFIRTLLVGVVILFFLVITSSVTDASRFIRQWNKEYIVQKFGIYIYTFNDIIQSIKPKISTLFGYDEAAREFREFYSEKFASEVKEKNEYTDIFKGKNVIFIHAESVQNFLIDLNINGQEITPTLNQLYEEGIYFSKFYPQISVGTSSDTEFTLLTGLMPSSSGTVFVSYFDRTYEAMPQFFNDLGYYTFSMHANEADYWNRKIMHKNFGYQDFFARGTYEETEEEMIGLGLSDKSFFNQIVPIIKDIKETKSPFFSTVITLSSHSPFKATLDRTTLDLTMSYSYTDENGAQVTDTADYLEGAEMGNYIKSVHYLDEALGQLIADLRENGILEDTVIILYGDHDAKIAKSQYELLYNYDPISDSVKDKDDPTYISMDNYAYDLLKNTPLIIWSGDEKFKTEVDDVMGMYDILPTVANMFGFETKYELGYDVFSDNEKIVIFPNGNFLTNKVYYNNLKDDYVSLTNEPIESDYIERLKEYTNKRLNVSNDIIVFDLIEKEGSKLITE